MGCIHALYIIKIALAGLEIHAIFLSNSKFCFPHLLLNHEIHMTMTQIVPHEYVKYLLNEMKFL